MELQRAYYRCGAYGKGHFPRDEDLGMRHTKLSPAVQRMSATAAAMTSFADAASLLEDLAGVRLIPKQVERTAEAIGHKLARAELADLPGEGQERPPAAPTMYVGVDGTGSPVRNSEVAGRKGKQKDGAARTREAKLVVVFTAEARDEEGRPQRDQGSVTYSAAIECAACDPFAPELSAFSQRVWREASRRGVFGAQRRVVIGDGAAWIWNLAHEQFAGAIEIVDLFHAKQEIWDVAKACFAGDRQRIRHRAEARCEELTQGRGDILLEAPSLQAAGCGAAARGLEYFRQHRQRKRYPEFRAQGLCVGSGVVEAGCKTAIGVRMKGAGMHWTVDGANAILALRCSTLSNHLEDFWADRATPAPDTAV